MIFWGFVMWFCGAVAAIMATLVGMSSAVEAMNKYGFGGYVARFFDVQFFSAKKAVLAVALILIVIGLIVFFLGRIKVQRTGEPEQAGARAIKYWRDAKGEYKKITWPTFRTVVKNTAITLAMCALVAAFVCLVDLGLSSLVNLLLSL